MQKSKNIFIIVCGVIIIALLGFVLFMRDNAILIDRNAFNEILAKNEIRKISLHNGYVYINTTGAQYKIAKDLLDLQSINNIALEADSGHSSLDKVLGNIGIVIILLLGLAVLFNAILRVFKKDKLPEPPRQQEQSHATNSLFMSDMEASKVVSNVTFDDIAGIKEVKDDLIEIIDYLKNPTKYQSMGVHLPKGVLLIGPPGVGKTMIAKAIAKEANVPFFYQSGSSFAQIYVGIGAKRVRELFLKAKSHAPSIIFIDEIDAVGKARGGNRNDEREATLNQLLTEMDGFENSNDVIVVGATNRVEILDSALLRSGRFDRRIYIDLPDMEERIKIIELYLRNKNHEVDVAMIARETVGFSGAGIEAFINESSLNALRRNSKIITNDDFFATRERVSSGMKKQLSFSEKEKNILSLYQAAKAISAYWCDIDFEKITLVGENIKDSDKNILSKTDLINRIKVALSGNVVLQLHYGETYTNCSEDIAMAKEIAHEMSERYGMAGRIITDSSDVLGILNEIQDELKIFFTSAKGALKEVQECLLTKEKITKDELKEILQQEMFN